MRAANKRFNVAKLVAEEGDKKGLAELIAQRRGDVDLNKVLDHLEAQIFGKAQTIGPFFNARIPANTLLLGQENRIQPILEASLLRVQVEANSATKMRIRSFEGTDSNDSKPLEDAQLAANEPRSFDFNLSDQYEYDVLFSSATTLLTLYMEEVPINA